MANFDIQYSTATPEVVRQPRANMNVDTGAGAIGNAVANFGGVLQQIGEKYQEADDALELSGMKRRYDEIGSAAMEGLKNVADPEEAQKIITQYQNDVGSLQSKRGRVNNAFQIHVNDTAVQWTDTFAKRVERNKVQELNDQFEADYKGFLGSGDMGGASELIANLKESGAITPVKAESLLKTFEADSYLQQSENLINKGDAGSIKNAESMLTAIGSGKIKLTEDQLKNYDNLKAQLNAAQNRSDSSLKQQKEKEAWTLWLSASEGTLKIWDLDKSVISANEKQQIWATFRDVQASKAKGEISALEKGNPVARNEMLALIELHPDRVTKEDISRNAGLIGLEHVASMYDRLDKNQNEKNPIATKYKGILATMYRSGAFGDKKDVETSVQYAKITADMDVFLAKNPTEEQASSYLGTVANEKASKGTIAKLIGAGLTGLSYSPPALLAYRLPKYFFGKDETANRTPPADYPDAIYDEDADEWVVIKDGKEYVVEE